MPSPVPTITRSAIKRRRTTSREQTPHTHIHIRPRRRPKHTRTRTHSAQSCTTRGGECSRPHPSPSPHVLVRGFNKCAGDSDMAVTPSTPCTSHMRHMVGNARMEPRTRTPLTLKPCGSYPRITVRFAVTSCGTPPHTQRHQFVTAGRDNPLPRPCRGTNREHHTYAAPHSGGGGICTTGGHVFNDGRDTWHHDKPRAGSSPAARARRRLTPLPSRDRTHPLQYLTSIPRRGPQQEWDSMKGREGGR